MTPWPAPGHARARAHAQIPPPQGTLYLSSAFDGSARLTLGTSSQHIRSQYRNPPPPPPCSPAVRTPLRHVSRCCCFCSVYGTRSRCLMPMPPPFGSIRRSPFATRPVPLSSRLSHSPPSSWASDLPLGRAVVRVLGQPIVYACRVCVRARPVGRPDQTYCTLVNPVVVPVSSPSPSPSTSIFDFGSARALLLAKESCFCRPLLLSVPVMSLSALAP